MGEVWEGLGRLLGTLNRIWEGLGLHLGRVGEALGRFLDTLGHLLAAFWLFKNNFFSSMGPILAPRSLSNAFWVDLGRVWEGLGEAKIAILAGIRKDLEHFQQALTDPL